MNDSSPGEKSTTVSSKATAAYLNLIRKSLLTIGEELSFFYESLEGKKACFKSIVREDGLEVDGHILNPTYAASLLIKQKFDDKRPINGWLAWQNSRGERLGYLHKKSLGLKVDPTVKGSSFEESFHKYPKHRDSVWIFGAGISIDQGFPLQKDLLPALMAAKKGEVTLSKAYKTISYFIAQHFSVDPRNKIYPSLEEVFGFIDYFVDKRESLSKVFTLANIEYVRESLIKLIHYQVNQGATSSDGILSKFWEHVYRNESNVSCVTLNYDTYLEDSFINFFPLNSYLDFCHELMNYQYHLVPQSDWWLNPREPMLTNPNIKARVFKFIKLHGSLNWRYCNCCNQLLIRPWTSDFHLERGNPPWSRDVEASDFLESLEIEDEQEASVERCPRDGNMLSTLLIPPSYKKELSHPVISKLLVETADEIRSSRRVIFVGYSLPEADVHIKAILAKAEIGRKEIIIINPSGDEGMMRRFGELSSDCEIIQKGFGEVLNDQALMERLLRKG